MDPAFQYNREPAYRTPLVACLADGTNRDPIAVPATPPPADEGAVRFAYALAPLAGTALPNAVFAEMRAWRRICKRLGLLGRDPRRYGGLGFGNLSARDPSDPSRFVITASQTGGARDLRAGDLVRIIGCNLTRFWVEAEGRKPPSSETLTHAMVYAADPAVRWVFHVHSPDIWRNTLRFGLPHTRRHVPYGTRALADAVAQLLRDHVERPFVFTTLGHEDGVFACGTDARSAGLALIERLAAALDE